VATQALPDAGARLTLEDGRPDPTWYQRFSLMWQSHNATAGQVSSGSTGLSTRAAKTQPEALTGTIQFADDGDYSFFCPYDSFSVTSTLTKSATGTCTATFKREGTALSGTPNSVSTSETTQTHDAVTFSRGDLVTVTISGASSCEGLSFMVIGTRTLA